jgi:pimeloyl-ACP methyl ester carboxylesterase
MRRLLRLSAVALAIYLAAAALLVGVQRSLLYPASDRRSTAVEAELAGFEDLVLTTPDGERIVAWWKPPQPGKAVILYFHGNGGSLWNRRFRARAFAETGRGLLLVSYRGYSGSTGSPTEEGLRIDARTAYDWLSKSYEPSRLVLYGESLGTGVAVRLATERQVAGLVLDAPYTSTVDVASLTYWFIPVTWLMWDQFRSIDIIKQVKAPILILHGDQDGIIPISLGERLYQAAPEPKRFVRLKGLGHITNLEWGGLEPVNAFIAAIEAKSPVPFPETSPGRATQP